MGISGNRNTSVNNSWRFSGQGVNWAQRASVTERRLVEIPWLLTDFRSVEQREMQMYWWGEKCRVKHEQLGAQVASSISSRNTKKKTVCYLDETSASSCVDGPISTPVKSWGCHEVILRSVLFWNPPLKHFKCLTGKNDQNVSGHISMKQLTCKLSLRRLLWLKQ